MTEPSRGRIGRLETKRDRIREQIRGVDEEIAALEKQLGRRRLGVRRPNARRLNDITVQDAVVELLRDEGAPMHYRDIARRLVEEERYQTRSKNFLSTVAISIMRDDRIERTEPGVYQLRA
jgi:hypothetical protein